MFNGVSSRVLKTPVNSVYTDLPKQADSGLWKICSLTVVRWTRPSERDEQIWRLPWRICYRQHEWLIALCIWSYEWTCGCKRARNKQIEYYKVNIIFKIIRVWSCLRSDYRLCVAKSRFVVINLQRDKLKIGGIIAVYIALQRAICSHPYVLLSLSINS